MNRAKKIGIMFIIGGFFIPLVLHPFTELTEDAKRTQLHYVYRGEKYTPTLNELEVVFRDEYKTPHIKKGNSLLYSKLSLRYPYIIAIGLTLILVGISIFVLSGKKKENE